MLCLIILATFREIGLFIPTSGRTAKILDLETERLWRRGAVAAAVAAAAAVVVEKKSERKEMIVPK